MIIDRRRLEVNSGTNIRPSLIEIGGAAGQSVLVLDNFYKDPQAVRELALSLDFSRPRYAYPGLDAAISLDPSRILKAIKRVVRCPLVFPDFFRHQMLFSVMSRKIAPGLRYQPTPHYDGMGLLAGLVYLNLPDRCRGGTAFYRHRLTGLLEAPTRLTPRLRRLAARFRVRSREGFIKRLLRKPAGTRRRSLKGDLKLIAGSTRDWELAALVEMKFNRLIFYKGSLFHSALVRPGDFGETPKTRRLTQNFVMTVR